MAFKILYLARDICYIKFNNKPFGHLESHEMGYGRKHLNFADCKYILKFIVSLLKIQWNPDYPNQLKSVVIGIIDFIVKSNNI